MPITIPAARADSDATSRPKLMPSLRTNGATVSAAKNPYTTVGIPASTSNKGLTTERVL